MTIAIEHVTRDFDARTRALDDVSLEIADGELIALLGPSGSGKTTLLRILAGLDMPDAGRIRDGGADLLALSPRARNVGLVFQNYALFQHLTVFENIAFALRVRHRPDGEVRARVAELLERVQLVGLDRRKPSQLSGGQQQRVALARALAPSPRFLLLDEPFGALDAQVRQDLRRWLRQIHDGLGVTTVLVTHDQEEAREVADRVAVLHRGKLEQVGTPTQVFEQPATDFVMRFLGAVNVIEHEGATLYVRPYELDLSTTGGGVAARVARVTPLGAAVRVELTAGDQHLTAELERSRADALSLHPGQTVWLSLHRARRFREARDAA